MSESQYNEKLTAFLTGRRVKPEAITISQLGKPMFAFWGDEAGFSSGDIHATRAYRIYLSYDSEYVITDASVVVEGELISPCSGYRYEQLDEFDYEPVLQWCLQRVSD